MTIDLKQTISLAEVAQDLNVDVSAVHRWRLRGIRGHTLKCFKLGGQCRTTWETVEEFVQATNSQTDPCTSQTTRTRPPAKAKPRIRGDL